MTTLQTVELEKLQKLVAERIKYSKIYSRSILEKATTHTSWDSTFTYPSLMEFTVEARWYKILEELLSYLHTPNVSKGIIMSSLMDNFNIKKITVENYSGIFAAAESSTYKEIVKRNVHFIREVALTISYDFTPEQKAIIKVFSQF